MAFVNHPPGQKVDAENSRSTSLSIVLFGISYRANRLEIH